MNRMTVTTTPLTRSMVMCALVVQACAAIAQDGEYSDPLGDLDDMSVVLTPSRLKQPIADSPTTISVISSETIKALGIRKIPEVLRLVPGMVVASASGNDYRVSYHGGTGSQPRRMQVLIDGASVYLGGLARVNWSTLPIAVEDILRVEVVRNPAGASYGANAFQAVVNIISKPSTQLVGTSLKGSLGDHDHRRWRVSHGTLQHTFSAWGQKDHGFDRNFEDDTRRDSEDITGARYTSQFAPTNASTLNLTAGYTFSELDVEFLDSRQTSFPDQQRKDLFLVADYRVNTSNNSDWRILGSFYGSDNKQGWNSCYENILYTDEVADLYGANPGYVDALRDGNIPSGGTEEDNMLLASVLMKAGELGEDAFALNCGDFNQDSKDSSYRLEVQNTWSNGDNLVSVAGIGVNYITAESDTFFNGTEDAHTEYLFYNAEYNWRSLTFNAGGMLEHTPRLDDPTDTSYRVATNWHIDSENTIRVAYSNATRTPDLFESDQKWSFEVKNLDTPVEGSDTRRILGFYPASDDYNSEKIDSFEVAYLFNRPRDGLYFQARVFRDELDNLNSSRINFFNTSQQPPGESTLKGAEIDLRYSPTSSTSIGLGYAYLDADASTLEEEDLDYSHSGHIYGTHSFNNRLQVSLAYYGSDNLGGASFDKFDLSVIFNVHRNLTADLVVSKRTTENRWTASDGFIVRNAYNDSTSILAGIEYSF